MKKRYTLILLILPVMLMAQRGPGPGYGQNRERIEAQKIAFLTEKLELTPAEAQVFWPVYNEFNAKREQIIESFRKRHKELRNMDEVVLSEEEAAGLADQELVEAQQLLDLRKTYHAKFKSVLPATKVLKLYRAEDNFKRVLLNHLREGRGGNRGSGPK